MSGRKESVVKNLVENLAEDLVEYSLGRLGFTNVVHHYFGFFCADSQMKKFLTIW